MLEFIQLEDRSFNGFYSENSLNIIYPFEKINIFIGDNNSGKSRFVRAIHSQLEFLKKKSNSITNYFVKSDYLNYFATLKKHFEDDKFNVNDTSGVFKNIEALIYFNDNFKDLSPEYFSNKSHEVQRSFEMIKRFNIELSNEARDMPKMTEKYNSYYIPVLRGLKPLSRIQDEFVYENIYNKRVSFDYGNKINAFTGLEIFEDIKSKLLGTEEEREIIAQFEKFLGNKIFKQSVTLIPKYKEDVLNIKIGDEEQRSIVHIGDGVQAMILILYPVFINKQSLCYFFIEEPETHLHPNFQKLLIKLLHEIGERHQFFITTHSNSFLNSSYSNIFEVKRLEKTIIKNISTDKEKFDVLSNLGYHASDLMQTNYIIWVEGPSDRIYLQYLINRIDPGLQENIHYSIMFYAGSTGKYLFSGDLDTSLILSLNRNCAYVCDSDRDSIHCKSTKYLQTCNLISNLNEKGIYAWMTPYRELENHLDQNLFIEAIRSIRGYESASILDGNRYSDLFLVQMSENFKQPKKDIRLTTELLDHIKRSKNKVISIPVRFLKEELQKCIDLTLKSSIVKVDKKVDIAEFIVKRGFEPDKHLKMFIKGLVARIRKANHI